MRGISQSTPFVKAQGKEGFALNNPFWRLDAGGWKPGKGRPPGAVG